MSSSWILEARELIRREEALRLKPYVCTGGRLTIGWGHNLTDNGIPREVAEMLFEGDFQRAFRVARDWTPDFDLLSRARQTVVISMAFQLGEGSLRGFTRLRLAIAARDWERAATEMLDSKWARTDTPARAARLAEMMQGGTWPEGSEEATHGNDVIGG